MEFEGRLMCVNGKCIDDVREYRPMCNICEMKMSKSMIYEDDHGDVICHLCKTKQPSHNNQPDSNV